MLLFIRLEGIHLRILIRWILIRIIIIGQMEGRLIRERLVDYSLAGYHWSM